MNIYINGRFLSQQVTGVQRFALESINALDDLLNTRNISSKFILLIPPQVKDIPKYKNIEVRVVGRLKGHLWEQLELLLFSSKGFLINLCNTAPIFKQKQFTVIHDVAVYSVPETYSFAFKLWYRLVYFFLSNLNSKIGTVSKFSQSELHQTLGIPIDELSLITEGNEHILRIGSDLSVIAKHDLANRPYILAVSSMTPNKNFGVVVKAIELLGDTEFDFVIAGGANPGVFSSTGMSLPKTVKRVGYVSDAELKALYENAACFVFPSLYEGFGLPPMEAMSCGCPVIASNQASIPEVCGDAAIYFNPKDPIQVAEKVSFVMKNQSLRDSMRLKGFQQVEQFSWKKAAIEIADIVESIS